MDKELNRELIRIKEELRAKIDGNYTPMYEAIDELNFALCNVIDVLRKMTGEDFETPKSKSCLFCEKPSILGPFSEGGL